MGQAKARGTKAARVTQALQRQHPQTAPRLVCKQCEVALTDVAAMDTQALPGISVAFSAHCGACQQDTWAVRGEPDAVRAFYETLEKLTGQRITLGTASASG